MTERPSELETAVGDQTPYPRNPRPGPLQRGDVVGRYVVLERLGKGGMGVVYGAYDPRLNRKVALKVVAPGDRVEASERALLREAQALAQLSHRNVATVHDVGAIDGDIFIAMEFLDGATLTQWLAETTRSPEEILDVFRQAGQGLSAAHEAGIVHRDFKPDNVIVTVDGRVVV
ncbi:MAG: serine/threonine-protein kinase, partial [Myxococcota bacterium]